MYKTVEVDVDVDLEDFDTDELVEELERRGLDMNTRYVDGDVMRGLLEAIWLNRRMGKSFDAEVDQMIYYGLGKIV